MLYEGSEDYETLRARFERIDTFLKCGCASSNCKITAWEGGDLKYLCLKCGLSGNFAIHDQCLWCEVLRAKLGSLDISTPRTLNSIRVNAHLPPLDEIGTPMWPFDCPSCGIRFNSPDHHALEVLTPQMVKSFPSTHKGCMWHQGPSTATEIDHMVPCVLHMRLRFMSTLWDWCIAPAVLVKDQQVAVNILSMLQRDGVNTTRLRKLNNFSDIQAVKKASFEGRGCDKVFAHFDDYLVASRSEFRDLGYDSF